MNPFLSLIHIFLSAMSVEQDVAIQQLHVTVIAWLQDLCSLPVHYRHLSIRQLDDGKLLSLIHILKVDGRVVVPPLYRSIAQPVGAYCAFEEIPRYWGIMTLKGKVIVCLLYTSSLIFSRLTSTSFFSSILSSAAINNNE